MIKIISRSSTFPGVDLEYAQVETIAEAHEMLTEIIRVGWEESGVCVEAMFNGEMMHLTWPNGNKLFMAL